MPASIYHISESILLMVGTDQVNYDPIELLVFTWRHGGHVGEILPKEFWLFISFVWDTNMATVSIVFCVSWDCVKTKNKMVII